MWRRFKGRLAASYGDWLDQFQRARDVERHRAMNVVDRWFRRIDVIRTGPAVNFVSNCIFYLFIAIVLSNVLLLLNYLLFGIDLCGLFLPLYEALGFPLFQRGVGAKNQHPFFCSFEVVARPVFFLYAALFCVLAILLFVSNIFDGGANQSKY